MLSLNLAQILSQELELPVDFLLLGLGLGFFELQLELVHVLSDTLGLLIVIVVFTNEGVEAELLHRVKKSGRMADSHDSELGVLLV